MKDDPFILQHYSLCGRFLENLNYFKGQEWKVESDMEKQAIIAILTALKPSPSSVILMAVVYTHSVI